MKLLILSDIHANWPALCAVLNAESDADQILCLGDLVDYGPQPVECVEWAMKNAPINLMMQGNHDWGVAHNEDPRCSPPYRSLTAVTQRLCVRVLGEEMLSFLRDLKPLRRFQIGEASCVACHATPSEPLFHYLRINGADRRLNTEIRTAGNPDYLFFGHTHWPAKIQTAKTLILNPGSVGQPKDGDPRAAYAVLQDGRVTLRRAAYDIEETVRAYGDTQLDKADIAALIHVLRTGGNLPEQMPVAGGR
jgi:putative phosphoesterase